MEGRQAVRELLIAGSRRVHEVFVEATVRPAAVLDEIVELADDLRVPIREVPRGRLDRLAGTTAPQGVVAKAAPLREVDLADLGRPADAGRLLVAFDGVTDPGNLGAALRAAECAGADGVVLARHRAVHITPAVTKAAAGAIEYLPLAVVGGIPAALQQLRDLGWWTAGLDSIADQSLFETDLSDRAIVLVAGDEGRGLGRLTRKRCDLLVRLPLGGQLDSLNVSTATAVACYEFRRQHAG